MNEKTDRNIDNPNASKKTPIPSIIPRIPNSIFMPISHMIPSRSNVNMSPGNFIDHPATPIKTSLTNETVKIQYIVAMTP